MECFKALNAINNSNIEKYGIPNAYSHGEWIEYPYWGIAMTLFEGNLNDRYNELNKNISELSILLIFKRVVSKLYTISIHISIIKFIMSMHL